MNISNWLNDAALRWPERPALFDGEIQVADYYTFADTVRKRAISLRDEQGIVPGDRVALFMKNCTQYLELLYAIWWAGAVAVPINCKLHSSEAAWIADNAEARLIFTEAGAIFPSASLPQTCRELAGRELPVRSAHAPASLDFQQPWLRDANDLAWLFYTSGTTGRSKGVMLSHGNLIAMSQCYPIDVAPLSGADAMLYAAPMSHGAGLYNLIFVRHGARHVIPRSKGFRADEIFGLARHFDELSLFAAPTMVKRMVEEARRQGYAGEGLKNIVYGGAPMYLADLQAAVDTFGPRLSQIYGQGESPMTITALARETIADQMHPDWLRRVSSVGQAQSCVDVRVVDANRQPVASGVPGEIAVRGATVMSGYWRNETATQATLENGWLFTGDIGVLDDQGFLTLTDRSKDLIISGGSNIYPREVEEVLALHPAVAEVCVVGEAEPDWGEIVVAFVATVPGTLADEAMLNDWFVQHMASFKKPRKYVFCKELPKSSYGKVLKTDLRQWLQEQKVTL